MTSIDRENQARTQWPGARMGNCWTDAIWVIEILRTVRIVIFDIFASKYAGEEEGLLASCGCAG
jgi:hypothetical protein